MKRALEAAAAGVPAALALLALAWPERALAHSLGARFGDFYGGLLHPATALDLAPPLVALGLLAGQNGKSAARRMLLVLPAALMLGTSLGGVLPSPAWLATVNAASFLVLGLLLALDRALPPALLLGLGTVLGLIGGLANSSGVGASDPVLFMLGSALAGLAAILVPSAVVVSLAAGWQRLLVRVVGSWLAAVGAMILALPQSALSG